MASRLWINLNLNHNRFKIIPLCRAILITSDILQIVSNHKQRVYLAGQANEHENNWKEEFKKLDDFDFYDWEFDSDQSSPNTFFPDDLKAVKSADILVANPGIAPSEGTWIEIGYFLALNTDVPGITCKNMIIIWKDDREPKWSIEFVKKAGVVVGTVKEAVAELKKLKE